MQNIIIDNEFQSLIPKISEDEYQLLEESILSEGCRDALVVWNDTIIDGHNRYEICNKHNLPYETTPIIFESKDDAKIWIIKNQLGRRNLVPFVRIELVDSIEKILEDKAKKNQGTRTDIFLTSEKSIESINTTKEMAKLANVGHDTYSKGKKIKSKASEKVKQAVRDGKISINKAYKDIIHTENREKISQDIIDYPIPEDLFDIIYADPPWQYEHSETKSRDVENQYPTMSLDEIKTLIIPSADNAVLFLWATAPKLEEAIDVINSWGFKYRTCAIWDKEIIGMGYWFRGQHELLLLGIKGEVLTPESNIRESSVYKEKRTEHSKKPDHYYQLIESYFPNRKYLELFARNQYNEKWSVWGNQIE